MARRIGRFEIRRELGRGAQSVVYLAHDPGLDREVAIKTLHFGKAEAGQNAALLAEARIVSRLRHPGIVPIFEAGEQDGDPFLVFEYVPGDILAAWLARRGPLPAREAAELMSRMLTAIGAAHAQGIIHRDLKPSNVLMDTDGMPRVMDFGIAIRGQGPAGMGFSGTPAYMAPEYIEHRTIGPASDVFAAGLILIEMVTGRRVFGDADRKAVMRRIVEEDARLPADAPAVDERLAGIALRAVARDPATRFQSADEFRLALEDYLKPADEPVTAPAGGAKGTIEFLLRRMRVKSDFPALSESVSAINRIASSESEGLNKLSGFVLRDFSLTNKLLRIVNSAHFRPAGGGRISTVSRAVLVLGFDAVRNIAITMVLFEHMQDKANVGRLKEEFLRANLAGTLARDMATHLRLKDMEQAFICATFANLGRLLAQFYFPEESEAIRAEMAQKSCSEDAACQRVLGTTYEELGTAIARSWGFPPLIVESMRALPPGKARKAATQEEQLRTLSAFSNEVCAAIALLPPEQRDKAMRSIAARFVEAMPVEQKALETVVKRSIDGLSDFSQVMRINLARTTIGQQLKAFSQEVDQGGEPALRTEPPVDTLTGVALDRDPAPGTALADPNEAGEKADDAEAMLTAGIQDISNALVEDFKLNDVLRIILETMYRAMGFKRVLLCVKDVQARAMQGRFGFGPDASEIARRFRFGLDFTPDIFHAALKNGVDILISDIDDPKIAARVPTWYRKAVTARTFVIFPLTIKKNPVALIYADRETAGSIVIAERELTLLRTLRNQALLALKQMS